MDDPFLLAHYAGPRVFDLAGKISPISIRDQMLRACMFVDRAVSENLIGQTPGSGLLILGGGACGATAAMRAAARGIPTVLLESSPRLLGVQARCRTRFLDPAQYDWPLDHWTHGSFPADGLPVPLSWTSGWSDKVAAQWRAGLLSAIALQGSALLEVQVRSHAQVTKPAPTDPAIFADLWTPAGVQRRVSFGAVLVSVGFGLENTEVAPGYRGFPFWRDDPFGTPNWGVDPAINPRVLISGAGDGALQDYLRIVTRQNSAAGVMNACHIPRDIAADLKDIDRQVAACIAWGAKAEHDHSLHMALDAAHIQQAKRALGRPGVEDNVATLLQEAPQVRIAFGCRHLTAFYGLNRFLTHLICTYVKEKLNTNILAPGIHVQSVAGTSHTCGSRPEICHGQEHEVRFIQSTDCTAATTTTVVRSAVGKFDIVIIRHGIKSSRKIALSLTPLAPARQILPYYLL